MRHTDFHRKLTNLDITKMLSDGCLGCARFAEIWLKYFEFHILWSLSSVDFHTLTLQLPIRTPNSVAPELQVFLSSLAILAKRAHPWSKKEFGPRVAGAWVPAWTLAPPFVRHRLPAWYDILCEKNFSYFLDRKFWQNIFRKSPNALRVCFPKYCWEVFLHPGET